MKLFFLLLLFVAVSFAQEPNPPNWPSSVYVFDPSTPSVTQQIVNSAFQINGGNNPPFNGQFNSQRYAFLFKPGTHNVQVNVGYYTSVIGLGVAPTDTKIQSVTVQNGDFDYTGGALSNFWRSAENFYTKPSQSWNNDPTPAFMWAVSQACPLRRAYIDGNVFFWQYNYGCCAGYSSGGYMADSIITGQVSFGSQQQFFLRNNQASWTGGVWNMVFVGNNPNPNPHCSNNGGSPYTVVDTTPVIAEKPYITIDGNGKYSLAIPNLKRNSAGPTTNYNDATFVDFSNVYVAKDTDSASLINSKISAGRHIILTGGQYNLTEPINVSNQNTVVLGIGFPTLISANGQPALIVTASEGVKVGGILLQAGALNTTSLLIWGKNETGNPSNPGFLYDCFARVGGTNNPSVVQLQTDVIVIINQGNVVIDNSWLWRADHGIYGEVYNQDNPVYHGLQVYGDNVIAYGLAVEHQLRTLVQWFGEGGSVYFFQSELPYDVTRAFGDNGYSGMQIGATVKKFDAFGVGVYSYFRDHDVTVNNAIVSGNSQGIQFTASLAVYLNGNGGINHVINNQGNAVNSNNRLSYVCYY